MSILTTILTNPTVITSAGIGLSVALGLCIVAVKSLWKENKKLQEENKKLYIEVIEVHKEWYKDLKGLNDEYQQLVDKSNKTIDTIIKCFMDMKGMMQ